MFRIDANDEMRLQRGWDPNPEKDQLPTEVELDDYPTWTSRFDNSDTTKASAKKIEQWIQSDVVLPLILEG